MYTTSLRVRLVKTFVACTRRQVTEVARRGFGQIELTQQLVVPME